MTMLQIFIHSTFYLITYTIVILVILKIIAFISARETSNKKNVGSNHFRKPSGVSLLFSKISLNSLNTLIRISHCMEVTRKILHPMINLIIAVGVKK